MKRLLLFLAVITATFFAIGQPLTGTKTIKTAGGNYSSIASAISDLNTNGVGTGGVTFNIDSNFTETAVNLVITATGTSSNPIIFQKVGTGANPTITAGTGSSTTVDGIITLAGTDYITFNGINLQESSSNTTATMQMEWGYAILKGSASDGCKNVTIRNCKVTLNKTNVASKGIYIANHISSSTTSLTVADTNGLNSYARIYNDTITNVYIGIYINGYAASSPYTLYDQNNMIGAHGPNVITNFGGSTSTVYGIYAIYQNNLKIAYNNINGGTGTTTTLYGIFLSTGTSSNVDIYNNTVTLATSGTTSQVAGIYNSMGNTANGNTVNMYNNIFQNSNLSTSTTAVLYCIFNSGSATNVNMYNNTVTGNTLPGSGTFACVYNSAAAINVNIYNNSVNGNTNSGTGTFYGIFTGSPTNLNVYNNNVYNNQKSGTSGTMYCVYASTAIVNFYGNNLYNNSIAGGTGILYGYYNYGVPSIENLYSNRIHNLTHSGSGIVYGIYTNTTSSATIQIYSDSVYGLSSAGGTIYGIAAFTGTNIRIYNNILFNLSSSTTSGIVYGIYISSGTNVYTYNNFVSDLKTPASTNTNAINGIYLAGGTNLGLYYNTVFLNASSTGTTFGSSGFYASTSPTVDMRNNIIVNNSTPGSTSGFTVAYRRSSATLTTYSSLSNNNCFYAGTPSTNKLIYYDGTNSDQTLSAFQTRVSARDIFSFSENPPFSNVSTPPYNLHFTTSSATLCEGGATPITSPISISTDIDGNTRNSTFPDVGADEGNFIDIAGPFIQYTALANTPYTTTRSLTATIFDANGVPTSGSGLPKLYWKINTGSWTAVTASSIGSNQYTFAFGGSVSVNDVIYYYIVAQDNASTPNISCSPSAGAGSFTSSPPAAGTPPTTPNSYSILPSLAGGTYSIGGTGTTPASGCTYVDLTAAFADLNSKAITGAVTLELTSYYSSSEEDAFPVVLNAVSNSSLTNSITIKPASGINASIAGSSASSIIKLNGADFIIIDGSNNGSTSRNLTISNTSTSATTAAVWLASVSSTNGATYNTIKNCNISAGSNSAATTYGITVTGTTLAAAGTNNDRNTIQNNAISKAYVGIFASGTGGDMDTLQIIGNSIGAATGNTTSYIGFKGIEVLNTTNSTISQNTIYNILTTVTTPIGLSISTGVTNTSITRNNINNIVYTGTSGYGARGMYIITGSVSSNLTIANNAISTIGGDGWSSFGGTSPVGLFFDGTTGGLNVYYNSINMNGTLTYNIASITTAVLFNTSTVTNINLRNNVFVNSMTNSANSTAKNYAIYSLTAVSSFTSINYNDYYVSGTQGILGYFGADITTLAGWRTATSSDANSISADPQYNSATILQPLPSSPLINAGTPISGITTDFNNTSRSSSTPTIGAYENGLDAGGPSITYTALGSTIITTARTLTATITDAFSGVPRNGSGLPRLYWKINSGSYTAVTATSIGSNQFTFTFGSGVSTNDTVKYYIVAQDSATTPNVTCSPSTGAAGFSYNPPAVSTVPTTLNSYRILGSIAGTFYVGTGQDYTTLTAAVNDLNNKVMTGAVNFILTDAQYSAETFPIVISPNGGNSNTNKLTIKPNTSVTARISGSSTSGIISINGQDYVTIDGSNSGGTDKNLTFENSYNTAGVPYVIGIFNNAGNPSRACTIKNCTLKGGGSLSTNIMGVILNAAGGDFDSTVIQNNTILKVRTGIQFVGVSGSITNDGKIINNIIGSSADSTAITFYGILTSYCDNLLIENNEIMGQPSGNTNTSKAGIYISSLSTNTKIRRNKIHDFYYTGTSGYGVWGIRYNSDATTYTEISNNLIYNIRSDGDPGSFSYLPSGIYINSGGNIGIYYNSIYMTGNYLSNSYTSYSACIAVNSGITTLNIKNNALHNSQQRIDAGTGSNKTYAIYSLSANTAFTGINNNDYFVNGINSNIGYLASDQATLAAWKTATTQDANSLSVNPAFTSTTDLHTTLVNLNSAGTPIATVTVDYTNATRNSTNPDIGAYEFSLNPTVVTGSDTLITNTTSRLQGMVNVNNEISTVVTFEYGFTTSYGSTINATPNTPTGLNNVAEIANLTGLVPNSTYHYRIKVVNGTGTFYGADSTFNTNSIAPTVTTNVVSSVLSTSAVLNGTVNPNNASSTIGFDFGTTMSYGTAYTADQSPLSNYANSAVTYTVTGLIPNTTYHYRVHATNAFGTSNGLDTSFTITAIVPTVETHSATSVTDNSATLNGMVNANNASSTVTIEWGTTIAYGNTETPSQSPVTGLTNTAVSSDLTSLVPNTTYHYRVNATNIAGTVNGADSTFHTNAIVPVVTTDAASSVTSTTATMNGTINANNASTTATFDYGITTSYGTTVTAPESPITGIANNSITYNLTGLTPNTTYHFRATGNNIAGTSNGTDATFNTTAIVPSVTTDAASSVTATSANLNGTVNANNDATTITIEWGLTTSYGNTVTPTPSSLSDYTSTPISFALTGLTPNSTYHYRVIATNSVGTTNGSDQSFNTNSIAPDATTNYPTAVGDTNATLHATVNANNTSTTVYFEWGLTTAYGNIATASPSSVSGYTNTAVSADLTTILPNSTYHFRVVAINFVDTTFGGDISFSTSSLAPTAYTNSASAISKYAATLNGSVNPYNSVTDVTFEYGYTTGYGNTVTATQSPLYGSSPISVTYNLTGLAPNATYHYRVIASSSQGTANGNDMTFNTPTVLADAVNTGASSITATTAIINGTVNPNNTNTIVHFEYGASTSYGNTVVATQSPLSGWTSQSVSYSLSNLIPNYTYHYRIKAMNIVGTAYSVDTTFNTTVIAPTATTNAATSVSTTGATLNATINAHNSSTAVTFEYGTDTTYGTTVTAYQSPITGYTNSPATYILTGLLPNTPYHYRVIATSTPGTSNGSDVSFTTPALIPNVTTNASTSLTSTSVVLNGTVNANNASTTVTFQFGTSTSYGTIVNASPNIVTGMTNTTVSYNYSGLVQNTTYHYRVVAVNSAGTSYGSDVSFTTPAVAPIITTNSATSITSTSAIMNGTVNANNATTVVVFDWGLTAAYGNTVTVAQSPVTGMTSTNVTYSLTGLVPNTTYHFRLRGTNVAGTVSGSDTSFSTPVVIPSATTNTATSIYPTGATFNGTVNANNSSTTVTFEYGTTVTYGSTVTATQSPVTGLVNTPVSYTVTGLIPNTTYHYRVAANNTAGSSYGSDQYFNTPAVMPTTSTAAATSVTSAGATLNGLANANNSSTTVTFQYGTSTTYGSTVTAAPSPITGITDISVTASISGLLPNTTYHFRTVASNASGIAYGYDFSFMTPAVAPTATTNAATSVVFNGATLNGVANANNSTTIVSFEYGTTTSYGSVKYAVQSPASGLSNTTVSAVLSGLLPNTTYHYKVVASNSAGSANGSDMSFTTSAIPAVVTTTNPTSIQANGATFNGIVYANNSSTAVIFEYGTTTSYGSSITATQSPVNGLVNTAVSYSITGLIPNTTYHYRVVGTNSAGTSTGSDAQFTTTLILPAATTNSASAVTSNSATLNGVINANNATATISFEYGMTLSYGTVVSGTPATANGTSITNVSNGLTGLIPNAIYHYRIVANNPAGIVYGSDQSFTTTAIVPTATSNAATTIQANHAVMNGTVNANNDNTTVTFEYGTTTAYGNTVNAVPILVKGLNNVNVSFELWNLIPNQTYHYRVVATNSAGTTNGLDASFTTTTVVPVAISDPANSTEETQAQLNGTVNAQNAITTVTIQWGTTTSYGNTVSPTPSSVTGNLNTTISFVLTGLIPNTEYHYRVVATNAAGTSYGIDRMFRTAISAPIVTTNAATAITATSATMNGTVNANNYPTDIYFEYGTSTLYGNTIQATPDKALGMSNTAVAAILTGLQPGITYHFRVVANNSYTEIPGNDMTFITSDALATVVTNAVSNLTDISITAGGNVTYEGGSPVSARGVCWSNSPNPTVALATKTSDGTGSGFFTTNVTNLKPQTHYFLRAYATNGVGTSYGDQITFNTLLNNIFEDANGTTVKIFTASRTLFVDIKTEQQLNNGKILVYDLNGKQVMTANAGKGMNTVDMTFVAKGAYLVTVVMGNNIYHNKVFVD